MTSLSDCPDLALEKIFQSLSFEDLSSLCQASGRLKSLVVSNFKIKRLSQAHLLANPELLRDLLNLHKDDTKVRIDLDKETKIDKKLIQSVTTLTPKVQDLKLVGGRHFRARTRYRNYRLKHLPKTLRCLRLNNVEELSLEELEWLLGDRESVKLLDVDMSNDTRHAYNVTQAFYTICRSMEFKEADGEVLESLDFSSSRGQEESRELTQRFVSGRELDRQVDKVVVDRDASVVTVELTAKK